MIYNTSRNSIIDIAKGIGIILVVFGHNWIVVHDKDVLFRVIFSFHVPLFFFLSGIFLRESGSLIQFIVSKGDSLLKPYLVMSILLGLAEVLSHSKSLLAYIFGAIYATIPVITWEQMWFLPHLFVALIFSSVIVRATKKFKHRLVSISCIAVFLAIVGVGFIDVFWRIDISNWSCTNLLFQKIKYIPGHLPGLPFSLDLIGISSACILLGFLTRDKVQHMTFNLPMFSISLLAFSLLHYYFHQTTDLALRKYANEPIGSLQAILGIYIVVAISALFDRYAIPRKILAYIGSSSLFILIFHGTIQNKTFDIFAKLSKLEYLSGILALIVAVTIPIVLLELTKRQSFLALLLLPIQNSRPSRIG
jgi:polysaccharide biosynthesis protein PslL